MITNNNISQSTESIIVCIDTTNASQKALQYGCIQAKKNNLCSLFGIAQQLVSKSPQLKTACIIN